MRDYLKSPNMSKYGLVMPNSRFPLKKFKYLDK